MGNLVIHITWPVVSHTFTKHAIKMPHQNNVDTDSVILDDEDPAQLIDGCFDDDDILSTDLVKDVESNAVTENTNKNNDVDSGKS